MFLLDAAFSFLSIHYWLSLSLFLDFFIAYTYNGTLIDTDKKRVKSYTSLFGIIKTGNWISADQFTQIQHKKGNKSIYYL